MPNSFYDSNQRPDSPPENTPAENTPSENSVPENVTPENNTTSFPDSSEGQMVVSVFTANQLLPVVNAEVVVTSEDNSVSKTSDTDRSGRTVSFSLPAPSASASQEPTVALPFAQYKVTITHPDYYPAIIENVQVFGDNLTLLPVNLIPLPELSNGNMNNVVIIPNQNL